MDQWNHMGIDVSAKTLDVAGVTSAICPISDVSIS